MPDNEDNIRRFMFVVIKDEFEVHVVKVNIVDALINKENLKTKAFKKGQRFYAVPHRELPLW